MAGLQLYGKENFVVVVYLHFKMKAARHGHADIVEELLDRGADPTIVNKLGKSPLQYATQYGHTAVISLLKDTQMKAE